MEKQTNGVLGLEQCVKILRKLESLGHVERNFSVKFLSWFSLSVAAHEVRIVETFIDAFKDDLKDLAAQLFDTFSDSISRKHFEFGSNSGGASA
ncbi:unnamed protein product [Cochlearia groenlandica]